MTQRRDEQVDRLVEVIARRVEAELEQRLRVMQPAAEASGCGSCKAVGVCDTRMVHGSLDHGARRIGASGPVEVAPCSHVAPMIDHTLLAPETTRDQLKKVCDEARRFGFASVCVNSSNIRYVAAQLDGSGVKPIAVVGFPLGAMTSGAKAFETREAIRAGAQEIDMVINIGALKSRDHRTVFEDIRAVVEASAKVPVKVILETSKLERDEKVMACALSKAAGAAFVKTSTGFGGGGATPEDVALMRSVVGEDVGVKASGGIRSIDDAERAIQSGANRLGTSASVAIVQCVRPDAKAPKAY